jgi:hypothetical protein
MAVLEPKRTNGCAAFKVAFDPEPTSQADLNSCLGSNSRFNQSDVLYSVLLGL